MRTKTLLFLSVLLGNFICAQNNIDQIKSIDSLFDTTTSKSAYLDKGSKEILRICTEVYYRSKETHYEKGMLKAVLKMSEVYTNEQQYEEALRKISEGIALAQNNTNYNALSQLYLNEGMVYSEIGYTKKSRQSLSKCTSTLAYMSEKEVPALKSSVYRTLARNIKKENKASNKDSVIIYLQRGYNESKKIDNRFSYKNFYLASFAQDLANEYYLMDKIPEAETYLSKFEEHLRNEKDHSDFISHYLIKGNIENKRKNYAKALEYFEESQRLINEYKIYSISLKDIYSGKAEAYQGLHDYKNQAVFATKAKKITDSISNIEKNILNSPSIMDKTLSSHEKSFFKQYIDFIYALIIFFVMTIIFFIYWFYTKKRNKNGENNESINNRLLTGTETNDADEQIAPSNQEDKNNITVENLEELIILARNNDKYFHLKFSKSFPTFNQQLLDINSQLTQSDLEYCALIKLNLSTKEIAQYKNTTVNSVVSKKYRIRKKLNINTNENIYTWMFNIG